VEHGMRFHRVVSITLLVLTSTILVVALCRSIGLYPRVVLIKILTLFCLTIQCLCRNVTQSNPKNIRLTAPRSRSALARANFVTE
jgi:hypothetical protein